MIVDGKQIGNDIVEALRLLRPQLPQDLRLGFVMAEGDEASASFVRIKERLANRLEVEVVRIPVKTTEEGIEAVDTLVKETHGLIVQLPLPHGVDVEAVLRRIPASHDVDAENPDTKERVVRAPVAEAIAEIFSRTNFSAVHKKVVIVGRGRLVGAPAEELLRVLGANVFVITQTHGSLDELRDADAVILGAGEPGLIKPEMLKEGVVLIDAGTSGEQGQGIMGDADPACAAKCAVFTPVPGGVGPIAVSMIFKNLFTLAQIKK
jgi:methylenetetrahydrofolate dehydrogenase (NADP+) / methenyltetrahydrofolate cyclohydrolase